MPSRLAIYWTGGRIAVGENPFGLRVANAGLFRALARHGGFEALDVLTYAPTAAEQLAEDLLGGAPGARIEAGHVLNVWAAARAGALLRGSADLGDLAWLRRSVVGDAGHSLVGLVHTTAPLSIRGHIAAAAVAPLQAWDALVCTSPAVQQGLTRMLEEWSEHLAERFGGHRGPLPQLPLIPLGVDAAAIAALADRPEARAAVRAELGVAPEDVVVLWVGRLSFTEKAFPQPMFRVVEEAAAATGARLHFALAGWFPSGEEGRRQYRQAADAHAPSVTTHFLDGNDAHRIGALWAGADVFLSLVDNIQETFGLAPVEAMAAGLPVVASDWDGYRYTIRDGREGMLVPTLMAPAGGLGPSMVARHVLQLDSYHSYAGAIAQHTAVHVGRAAAALAALVRSPELRRTMGRAGRQRVREMFDWPVVAARFGELVAELAAVRAAAGTIAPGRGDPVRGDPFRDFAAFATGVLAPETRLAVRPGVDAADLERSRTVELDAMFGHWRASPAECAAILGLLASGEAATLRELSARFPGGRRRQVELAVVWMAKLGLLDWLPEGA